MENSATMVRDQRSRIAASCVRPQSCIFFAGTGGWLYDKVEGDSKIISPIRRGSQYKWPEYNDMIFECSRKGGGGAGQP